MTGSVRALLAGMLLGAGLGAFLGGCAAGGAVDTSVLTAGTTGALAKLPGDAAASIAKGMRQPKGTPNEIYTRVARGLLTCWMAGPGSLRERYLYQAEAQPDREGGVSKISLHERVMDAPNQPGRIAYQVLIEPVGETATVGTENRHLEPALSDNISQDIYRWAAGEETCTEDGVTEGWGATPAAEVAPPPELKGKGKEKVKRKP